MDPKSVLIIDDNKSLQLAYEEKLFFEGITSILASDGKTGLSQAQIMKPDVIILDIMLPGGINGFDVLEELKRNELTKHIPVIVLTNLDDEQNIAKQVGASDYFVKANTKIEDIINRIKDILTHVTQTSLSFP